MVVYALAIGENCIFFPFDFYEFVCNGKTEK